MKGGVMDELERGMLMVSFVCLRPAPVNNHPQATAAVRGTFIIPVQALTEQEAGAVAGLRIAKVLAESAATLAAEQERYNAENPVEESPQGADDEESEVKFQA